MLEPSIYFSNIHDLSCLCCAVEPSCPELDNYNNNTLIYLDDMTVLGVHIFSLVLLEIQYRFIMHQNQE